MLAAQPEVLFTYPTPTGDYDKIGRPSLQDGVGRLTRFSPRDDHGKVVSVEIQRLRPDREPLASPGWALTASSCSLMLCCPAAVGFSEPPSALRAPRWSRVVSRAGA